MFQEANEKTSKCMWERRLTWSYGQPEQSASICRQVKAAGARKQYIGAFRIEKQVEALNLPVRGIRCHNAQRSSFCKQNINLKKSKSIQYIYTINDSKTLYKKLI